MGGSRHWGGETSPGHDWNVACRIMKEIWRSYKGCTAPWQFFCYAAYCSPKRQVSPCHLLRGELT